MGGKDPAMLFYTADFLTGTALLSLRERGQYITLLCYQQQLGHMSLREMEKIAGKLSPALLAKFTRDEGGKLYNARAQREMEKRAAHCQLQRERVNKRWNDGGTAPVLPLENEDENRIENIPDHPTDVERARQNGTERRNGAEVQDGAERQSGTEPQNGTEPHNGAEPQNGVERQSGAEPQSGAERRDEAEQVLRAYRESIEPRPSAQCQAALRSYTATLGACAVCHAIDVAHDNGKKSWSYIKAILLRYAAQGIRTPEDIARDEGGRRLSRPARAPHAPHEVLTDLEGLRRLEAQL